MYFNGNRREVFQRAKAAVVCANGAETPTCRPIEQNSITLDDELKDAWRLPAMRVPFQSHADDIATMRFLLARQMEILETGGAILPGRRP